MFGGLISRCYAFYFQSRHWRLLSMPPCVPAGLHGRAGVQGFVPRGGRNGGAARPMEPPGGEKHDPAGGGNAEGQIPVLSIPTDEEK